MPQLCLGVILIALLRVQYTSSCQHQRHMACSFFVQLNIKLYSRREFSGQRGCHPSQVLGVNGESSLVTVMDRQAAVPNNEPYGSATAPARAGGAYEAPPQAGNSVRR